MKRFLALVLVFALIPMPVFAQADMLNIRQAQIVNAPNVADWPITTALTSVSFDGAVTRVDFTRKEGTGRWPDVTPPGWKGPLEYTLWLFVNNGGQWVGSGFIQFWNGRDGSGSSADPDVPSLYVKNWYYAERWAPIFGHGAIRAGEEIGFMVTSGNQRDSVGPDSVMERSNVVTFPATDNGHYSFSTAVPPPVVTPPPVIVPPVVVPPVVVPQPSLPSTDLLAALSNSLSVQLQQCMAEVRAVHADLLAGQQESHQFYTNVNSVWKQIGEPFMKYVIPAIAAFLAGKHL